MSGSSFIALLVASTLGQFPSTGPGYGGAGYGAPAYGGASYGAPAYGAAAYGAPTYGGPGMGGPGASQYGGGAVYAAPDSTQAFGTGDPLYLYDYEPNWVHGYYQEIPAYGGYNLFRPYNYKHVMPQSQVSGAWGNSANMPYSHQYFDRVSGKQTVMYGQPSRMSRTNPDLNSRLARIERERSGSARHPTAPAVAPFRKPALLPAGHRENEVPR